MSAKPTVLKDSQDWANTDGVTAWHLIKRHADNWDDVGQMMDEFIAAKIAKAAPAPQGVAEVMEKSLDAMTLGRELLRCQVAATGYANVMTKLEASIEDIREIISRSTKQHSDDIAVDRFAVAMKNKLARKRDDGYGGWDDQEAVRSPDLARMLIEHIPKGDPVDVANFAMMIHQRDALGIENMHVSNTGAGPTVLRNALPDIANLQAKEQVLMDIHAVLGTEWGKDIYAAITALVQERDALKLDKAHHEKVIEDRSREAHQWWSALQVATARVAELEGDAARLDWLEAQINKHGAIHLHDGNNAYGLGLGLRPGLLVRTLRHAIDDAKGPHHG